MASAGGAGISDALPQQLAAEWEAAGGSAAGMSCRTAEAFGSSAASVASAREGNGASALGGGGGSEREAPRGPLSSDPQHLVNGTRLCHGWMCGPLGAHWSDYYKRTPREPSNTEVAPWVIKRHAARRQK